MPCIHNSLSGDFTFYEGNIGIYDVYGDVEIKDPFCILISEPCQVGNEAALS